LLVYTKQDRGTGGRYMRRACEARLWRVDTQLAKGAAGRVYHGYAIGFEATGNAQTGTCAGRPGLARLYSLGHRRRYVISQLMNLDATDCLI